MWVGDARSHGMSLVIARIQVKSEVDPYIVTITTLIIITITTVYIQFSKSSAAPRIPTLQHYKLALIPVRIPEIPPFRNSYANNHSQHSAYSNTNIEPAAPITTSMCSEKHQVLKIGFPICTFYALECDTAGHSLLVSVSYSPSFTYTIWRVPRVITRPIDQIRYLAPIPFLLFSILFPLTLFPLLISVAISLYK